MKRKNLIDRLKYNIQEKLAKKSSINTEISIMTKLKLPLKLAALTLATISSLMPLNPVKANTFDETMVEQTDFIAVSQPFGDNKYNLIVIEQIPNKQTCWAENGTNPVNVDILLINFDFSGHCRRSTDANGYSIRFNGQDLGLDYLLSIIERNGEIQLIGSNRIDRRQPDILVGTTKGMINGAMKIQLAPGWRFSKRTYQGKMLGHVYFSYTDEQAAMDAPQMTAPEMTSPETTTPEMNVPRNNEDINDPTNLDSLPDGGVEIIPPETNKNEEMMNESTSINEDSQTMMRNTFT